MKSVDARLHGLDNAPMNWTEIVGYIASAFVAGSLLMVSIVKLRLINLIGSATFVVYGVLIGSIPLLLTNAFITCVNVYHLLRISRADVSGFSYLAIDESQRHRLEDFLALFRGDVQKYFPAFAVQLAEEAFENSGRVYLAIRHLKTVGFACCMPIDALDRIERPSLESMIEYVKTELEPARTLFVPVDYITAKYRDLGLVHTLHKRLVDDLGGSAHFLVSIVSDGNRRTKRFLEQSGHVLAHRAEGHRLYVKTLG